jgi:citronellol/citronellal dehydrogenase
MHRINTFTNHILDSNNVNSSNNNSNNKLNSSQCGGWLIVNHPGIDVIDPKPKEFSLKGKTIFITGGSRGIGLSIGLAAARDGANVVLAAKTTEEQPNLEGTIHTAAAAVEKAGGKALAVKCDVRDEESVKGAIQAAVDKFGGIDILVNNASAIQLTGTLDTTMKRYDLMHQVDGRATFMVSKYCIPHLLASAKKGRNPHVLTISPPLSLDPRWFKNNVAYATAKFNMSLMMLGMSEEFKKDSIAFNTLWPRTAIATAAVQNLLGGKDVVNNSRSVESMSDAAYAILTSNCKTCTGQFLVDDEVLVSIGVSLKDMEKYNVTPGTHPADLAPDFFC